MTSPSFLPWPCEEPVPFPPRPVPQPEAPGRAPCCGECNFLGDTLGHVWACVAPGGRLRRSAAGQGKTGAA